MAEAAPLLGYKSGESLRKARKNGRNLVAGILWDLTMGLIILAYQHDFRYQSPPPSLAPSAAQRLLSDPHGTTDDDEEERELSDGMMRGFISDPFS